jgi:hypothetical protein
MVNAKSARTLCVLGSSLAAGFAPTPASAAIHGSGTEAIHGSGTEAIHGSGVEAIHGSGAEAIHGSGVEAIHGSGAEAIHGSGGAAIHGSGAEAIHGSGVEAIHGSGGAAIHGSGAEAIHGSGGAAIHGSGAEAIGSGAEAIHGSGSHALLLSGPIQQIDFADGTFVSVGQTVSFGGDGFAVLRVGDFVDVYGSISGAGTIDASEVGISGDFYVPGATEVFVTGIPSSIDFLSGTARIGSLTIDYTPSLGGSEFGGIGAAITVIGTQPAHGGAMLGDRVIDMTNLFLGD